MSKACIDQNAGRRGQALIREEVVLFSIRYVSFRRNDARTAKIWNVFYIPVVLVRSSKIWLYLTHPIP